MSPKAKPKERRPDQPRRKLSRSERQQIALAISRAKPQGKNHMSAQDSIPYLRMLPDGICQVSEQHYTKSVSFQDIYYQLSQKR